MSYGEIDIIRSIPQILNGKNKTLLYVGINQRRAHLLRFLFNLGYNIEIIEIFGPNVEFNRKFYAFPIIQGDIRQLKKFTTKVYDVIAWIHGPEHIAENELKDTLKVLENQAKNILLIGPNGKNIQDEVDNNIYEKHLWSLDEKVFVNLGYNVRPANENKVLVVWK